MLDAGDAANRESRKWSLLLWLGLFLLVLCYLPYLCGSREYVLVDCQFAFQPDCKFIGDCIRKGILPFWNPRSFCGFSQVSLPTPGLFYPLNYLLFLLPYSKGEAFYLLLHQFLAGIATFFFVEKHLKNKEAAIFGAFSMMFCGYMFAMFKFPDFVSTVCALTYCLWTSAEFFRAAESKLKTNFAILCFCAFLFYVSGRPEVFIPGSFLLLVNAVCELWRLRKLNVQTGELLRLFVFWSLALICGMLLAGPMITTGWEWTKLSPRANGLIMSQVLQWSAGWYDFMSMVFWRPFGDLDQAHLPAGTIHNILHTGRATLLPFMPSSFMGPGFFTALCLGLSDKSFKSRALLMLLILGAIFTSAGDQTPIAPFILNLFPHLAILRYPVKILIFVLLPAIFAASAGLGSLLEKTQSKGKLYFFIAFWLLVLALGPALYYSGSFGSAISALCTAYATQVLESESQITQHDLFVSFIVTGLCGAVFTAIAILFKSGQLRRNVACAGLLSVAVAPMIFYGFDMKDKGAEGGYYEKPAALDLAMQRIALEYGDAKTGQYRITHLVDEPLAMPQAYERTRNDPWFLNITRFGRDVLLADTQIPTQWSYANGCAFAKTLQMSSLLYDSEGISGLHEVLKQIGEVNDYPLERFCALSNSKYVVIEHHDAGGIAQELDPQLFTLVKDDEYLNLRIYRVKNFGSRFYFASKIEFVPSWTKLAQSTISAKNHTIYDDNTTYLSVNDMPLLRQAGSAVNPALVSSSRNTSIESTVDEPGRVEFSLFKKSAGLLVLRDQYYPGWRVQVDGKTQPLLRANLFNRAVFVPPGQHKVVFQYRPQSLVLGFEIASGALMLAALCMLFLQSRARSLAKEPV